MDLTPSFGHQELYETLSQASSGNNSKSKTGSTGSGNNSLSSDSRQKSIRAAAAAGGISGIGGGGGNRSLGSQKSGGKGASSSSSSSANRQLAHYTNSKNQLNQHQGNSRVFGQQLHHNQTGQSSVSSQNSGVDEAVRRLGYRLSLQAHGDSVVDSTSISSKGNNQQRRPSFQTGFKSCFEPYDGSRSQRVHNSKNSVGGLASAMSYDNEESGNNHVNGINADFRTSKVAKKKYSDHGELNRKTDVNGTDNDEKYSGLIRKLTYEAKDHFRKWGQQTNLQQNSELSSYANSNNLSSPHQYALSQLGIQDDSGGGSSSYQQKQTKPQHEQQPSSQHSAVSSHQLNSQQQPERQDSNHLYQHRSQHDTFQNQQPRDSNNYWSDGQKRQSSTNVIGGATQAVPKGLLSAVLEGHSDSSTTISGQLTNRGDQSISTPSISTKASSIAGGANHNSTNGGTGNWQHQQSHHSHGRPQTLPENEPPPVRGRCLTSPSEPVANSGLDNVKGNLIVYENDVIIISSRNMRSLNRGSDGRGSAPETMENHSIEYQVSAMQGQGTFAQVFRCFHVQSGQHVAVKVIKNKPAYTRQAAIEIDIFQTLQEEDGAAAVNPGDNNEIGKQNNQSLSKVNNNTKSTKRDYMVNLICYFMYHNHLCLVFELLGLNLYEVLKQRQFRGLPLSMVREITQQAVDGIRDLAYKNVVHCDLKPENMLLVSEQVNKVVLGAGGDAGMKKQGGTSTTEASLDSSGCNDTNTTSSSTETENAGSLTKPQISNTNRKIKLIDFGSACFEGYTAHTYIQSRFYRSPEVLIGVPYDSSIDMWSLGCVAAELFLGLPILPGVHEHDQVGRILEMIAPIPNWMLDQGSKSAKYYVKFMQQHNTITEQQNIPAAVESGSTPSPASTMSGPSPAPSRPQWRIKTQQEYINSLSQSEIRKKGGLARLQRQLGNRYFKRTKLADILVLHAKTITGDDKEILPSFVHFLYGILDPDPWKRWTAHQAAQHPFVTGELHLLRSKTDDFVVNASEENQANIQLDVFWQAPFDPAICRRKLLNVQKLREKQQAGRRNQSGRPPSTDSFSDRRRSRPGEQSSISGLLSMSTAGAEAVNGPSPPNQVSTPGSTNASLMSYQVPSGNFTQESNGTMENSYNDGYSSRHGTTDPSRQPRNSGSAVLPGNGSMPGASTNISHGDQLIFTGPLSFNGAPSRTHSGITSTEGDFGYALQRPGVFPDTFSVSSQTSNQSYQQHRHQQGSFNFQYNNQTSLPASFNEGRTTNYGMQSQAVSLSSHGQGNTSNSQYTNSIGGSLGGASSMVTSVVGSSSVSGNGLPNYYGTNLANPSPSMSTQPGSTYGGMMSSANSSVNMNDASYMDSQQQLLLLQQQQLQQQQLLLLQQQQLQQQQQLGFGQQPNQMLMQAQQGQQLGQQPNQMLMQAQQGQQLGQQPNQMLMQAQQPIFLAGAPGGGYYYVTTSASGQPIVLQPVGVLNQPLNGAAPTFGQNQMPGGQNLQQQDLFNPLFNNQNQLMQAQQANQMGGLAHLQ